MISIALSLLQTDGQISGNFAISHVADTVIKPESVVTVIELVEN